MDAAVIVMLIAVVAVVVVIILRARAKRAESERAEPAPRRDPLSSVHGNEEYLRRLKVGDVIAHEGSDFLVRGTLRFDEDGFTWAEHLISDGDAQRWLSVEDDEGISVVLWQRLGAGELGGEPGSTTLAHGGERYELQEQGEATFLAEGTTGTAPSGTARYVDYRGADGRRLSCERFGQSWEVSVGHTVLPRSLDVYPVSE